MTKFNKKLRISIIIFVCAIACTAVIIGILRNKNSTSVSVDGNELIITGGGNKTVIQVCSSNILKVHYLPQGKETAHSEVVGNTQWGRVNVDFDIKSNPMVIKTDSIIAKIDKKNYRVSVYDKQSNLLLKEQDTKGILTDSVSFNHNSGDNFYGIRGYDAWENSKDGMLRTGQIDVKAGKQGYPGGPFVWSTSGYGILVDSNKGSFNLSDSLVKFSNSSKKDIEYYIMAGSPVDIMSATSSISGRAPMFPKWAMGFTNSEWGIDQKELNQIIDTYRAKNIPIDNYTLDFDWKAWGEDNYGEFRWNTTKFPDGPSGKLQKDMEAKGIKLTGIMKPRISVDTEQGKYAAEHNFWYPSRPVYADYFSKKKVNDINFALEDARAWFFDHIKNAYNTGIVGWWNDEADDGFNSTQFMNMQRSLYDGQRGITNNRVWSINRNFFLGAQRYAYGLWSGDIKTGMQSMAMQRERMLSSINIGAVKWGMDTGGFSGGKPTSENYTRWMQFSAFTPIFRVHGDNNQQRQPWVYGSAAEQSAKDVMQLRYRLIPYIYSYERRSYENGLGLVKPLIYDYPKDKNVANDVDAWMFGDYMLVSPIVEVNKEIKNIYLPEGSWIDYFTGERYAGGKSIEHKIDNDNWKDIPLFIKKGAIMPSQDFMNYVGEKPVTNIYVDIFADKTQTAFKYYDDDGKTYDYEKGVYFIQNMTSQDKGDNVSFTISERQGSYTPDLKYYILKIHERNGSKVLSNGAELKQFKNFDELMKSDSEGWVSDKDIYGTVTYVKVTAGFAKDIQAFGSTDIETYK